MAVFRERKDSKGQTSFQVVIRLKGHPQEFKTFKRLTDAKKWATMTEASIMEGRYFKSAQAKKHTLTALIERYERDVACHRKDEQKIRQHLAWWKKKLGPYMLSDITPVLLSEYRDKLLNEPSLNNPNKKKSSSTVNRYIASLSIVFSTAVYDWGWIEDNPLSKVRKPKEAKGRERFLKPDEHKALLAACEKSRSPYLYPVVVFALSTGARWSEILGLKWEHVDFDRKMVCFEYTKNGEHRSVPISGHIYEILLGLRQDNRIDSLFVFPSQDGTKPADIRDGWDAALRVAKIDNFRFHDLRHTAASYLAMNGASLLEIAAILGHKTLAMVKRYSHLTDQHTAGVLEKMNSKQFG